MDEDHLRLAARGLFLASAAGFVLHVLISADRAQLVAPRGAVLRDEELRERRDRRLAEVNAREVFPAGSLLTLRPDGGPAWRPVLVAVTDPDLVVLDSTPWVELEEVVRISRNEVTGIRLLDEHGETVVLPPTEIEELDAPERRFVVWVDREADGVPAGHAFAFLSWSVAAEAERDFRRQVSAGPK